MRDGESDHVNVEGSRILNLKVMLKFFIFFKKCMNIKSCSTVIWGESGHTGFAVCPHDSCLNHVAVQNLDIRPDQRLDLERPFPVSREIVL